MKLNELMSSTEIDLGAIVWSQEVELYLLHGAFNLFEILYKHRQSAYSFIDTSKSFSYADCSTTNSCTARRFYSEHGSQDPLHPSIVIITEPDRSKTTLISSSEFCKLK